ncbi:probable protein phosphatase 2C 55 [Selaginella moellendorffii]|nr:probable protein phosphatase 2C 55 [Selaginella moellendorffii]XP_024523993.1 probable protein phosphatase 2C 55 [Selaginella moellendorffii]|eukprot:XP_002963762.2 probable protein phosphatase 2C 55 [Selaginella moellendorffii]
MQCSPSCELRMPTPQIVWKLKAGTSSSYRQSQHRLNVLFGRAKAAAAYPVYSSAKTAIGGAARGTRRVPPSSSSSSSSSSADSSNFEEGAPLSVSEAFSRAFATPSVFGPAWQSCSYQSWQLLVDGRLPVSFSGKNSGGSSSCVARGGGAVCEFQLDGGGGGKEGRDSWSKWIENTFSSSRGTGSRGLLHDTAAYHCFRLGQGAFDKDAASSRRLSQHNSSSKEADLLSPGIVLDSDTEGNVSGCSEGTAGQSRPLTLVSGACYLPHPDKQAKGGEDAHFICDNEKVVGVADGVGGWADVGVDAGQYARELMVQSIIAAQQEPHGLVDPVRILVRAHSKTKCKGSSTACILALSDNGLQAANLGDSGFIVLRNGKTVFKSPVQQHLFNIPYQLEHGGSDPPTCAQVFSVQVAAGDVIVVGTDGLFDNVYDTEVASVVVHSTRSGFGPQLTAEKLATLAKASALDRNRQTPFAAAAQDAGYRFHGGKMDDITVVVSYIASRG